MDINFWIQKWENNDIAFHESKPNPALVQYFSGLGLAKGCRVFLPLCGKTLDMAWLLSQGYQVVGAELSRMAIEQLFAELKIKPEISERGEVVHYRAKDIDIFVGNIFDVSKKTLGPADAIYDRAALVALPETMRHEYTAHIMEITDAAPQLLLSYEYDQSLMEGPPFSVTNEEVKCHYGKSYDVKLMDSIDIPGGLKGKCPAKEHIWLLSHL
ncbi:MAG: thiopurine S-methyltransferase [Candidatus Omnitrophica bacterium]|nr:thiopurine S-methyltransferase [Candidatus Omnitrophota bacterium]